MFEHAVFKAGDLMTRDIAVVHPGTSLLDAAKLMLQRQISGLPVVDDADRVVGMLTEGDLVRWHEDYTEREAHWLDTLADGFALAPEFVEAVQSEHRKVKAVMSAGVTTVEEDTPARDIASLMHLRRIKRVPVLRDGKLVGIVSRSDLVRALVERLSERRAEAPQPQNIDEALRRGREERKP